MTKHDLVPEKVWKKIRDEIAPQLISEGQALMTADEDTIEQIFDDIRKLDIRLDNLLNEYLIVPRDEAERYRFTDPGAK